MKYRMPFVVAGFCVAGLALASPAMADPAPDPSGSDVSSWGSVGDSNLGGSLGMDGYTVSVAGTTVTSSGWPVSRTQVTGPMFNYDATTDYNSGGTGNIEHWSTLQSPSASFDHWFEYYYDGQYEQNTTGKIGDSTFTVVCHEGMCVTS